MASPESDAPFDADDISKYGDPWEDADQPMIPGEMVERTVCHCPECAEHAPTAPSAERDHDYQQSEITEAYDVGFSREKIERCWISWKAVKDILFNWGVTLSALPVWLLGIYWGVTPPANGPDAIYGWIGIAAYPVIIAFVAWFTFRSTHATIRSRRLVAYHEWSPETGVTVVDRTFAPSWDRRLRTALP